MSHRPGPRRSNDGLADDPRWKKFNDRAYVCPCCGRTFCGIFDIAMDHPDPWPHGNFRDHDGDTLSVGKDMLGSDLCRCGEHFFVRGVLEIPVLGTEQQFGFGVWASLKEENFRKYVKAYNTEAEREIGTVFGWLSNELPGYETTDFAKTSVHFRGEGARPLFEVFDENHPASRDQSDGISFDRLLDIYAASGSDLRPHLTSA